MPWTIDETRVRPFMSAADRRDLLTMLRRPGDAGHEQDGDALGAAVPGRAGLGAAGHAPGRPVPADPVGQAPKFKDFKDGKDFKDWKDSKDTKDTKDHKDFKDFKDFKDGTDGAHPGAAAGRIAVDRSTGLGPVGSGDAASARTVPGRATDGVPATSAVIDEDDIGAVLRASRVNQYLRAAGVVI
ncbi:hypothetical protein [Parafrankia sp. EUN1f]|uniref:hypothetical protein n=1 Tax=Parafrankia sp. EUN1f TaxID=102897 RepID=UPI0001C44357|nr:hypothetical protein [Parafrankia sp. EUN1f]EFC83439.1 hypothetical protein FrEUN1fDRAFT_3437 [Parafrankia sp. EUN1f]